MSAQWIRTRSLALPLGQQEIAETWALHEGDRTLASYPVDVRLGKPFDVLRMKGRTPTSFRAWMGQEREAVSNLYAPTTPRRRLTQCPCCGGNVETAPEACRIYGVGYHRCPVCAHVFVRDQPMPDVLSRMFTENDDYAQDYVSKESLDQRLREIVRPKLDWAIDHYRRHCGGEPKRAVDIGAGGGHFVACCGQAGLSAEGYEINKAAIRFAKEAFDVRLRQQDFLTAKPDAVPTDLVTYWGLLEYTPEPARFIAAARRWLSDRGMLIIEVPRFDAFGSAIQTQFPDAVWRHLAPSSHMNIFSDASLANVLHNNGFKPVAAWYFGMDFYELLTQFGAELDDPRVMDRMGPLVSSMQSWLDCAGFVDDLVVAAIPN